jgi:hypothetical protein
MVSRISNGAHKFSIKGKDYEVFFAEDGQTEVYEMKDPGKTGFFFPNLKNLILFINNLTDIAEGQLEKG